MTVRIIEGDCRQALAQLADSSVHCCVTSPPYFGLRDYGMDEQIGLEASPEAFVAELVDVFRGVHRVLRDDGTLWLNLGDSYHSRPNGSIGKESRLEGEFTAHTEFRRVHALRKHQVHDGLKHKDLMGMPWRVAFALQADGWWLRQDIIWQKPNPMPESVRDRCTKAHEYLFLLSKSERYYFDREAMQEPAAGANNYPPQGGPVPGAPLQSRRRSGNAERKPRPGTPPTGNHQAGSVPWEGSTRNRRSVWTVATEPFRGAHFATFPPALIEPCILAGSPVGGTVLDPFGGAGTTGLVADRHQRDAVLIELNPAYAAIARSRIGAETPLLTEVA